MFSQVFAYPRGGGEGWLPSMHHRSLDRGVGQTPQIHGILRDTNKRAERILLECILVSLNKKNRARLCVNASLLNVTYCCQMMSTHLVRQDGTRRNLFALHLFRL